MSVRRKILFNLSDRVYPINQMCARRGLEIEEFQKEINKMCFEHIVEVNYISGMPLYRLSFSGRNLIKKKLKLVVDNTHNLV